MNPSQLGLGVDLFFERDECIEDEDIFRKSLFNDYLSLQQNGLIKQENESNESNQANIKNTTIDLNNEGLLDSFFVKSDLQSFSNFGGGDSQLDIGNYDFASLKEYEDFDMILDNASENVFDPNESASDSGISNNENAIEAMLSPSSGFTSPDPREDISVDTIDTISDVSSGSDLGSIGSLGNSPVRPSSHTFPGAINFMNRNEQHYLSFNDNNDSIMQDVSNQSSITLSDQLPNFEIQKPVATSSTFSLPPNIIQTSTATTTIPRIKFETLSQAKLVNVKNVSNCKSNLVTKVRIDNNTFSCTKQSTTPTYVVTQAGKGNSLLAPGTLLKGSIGARSILLPVKLNDINKVRTIKIISPGSSNSIKAGTGVRAVVSTSRPATTLTTTQTNGTHRTTTFFTTTKGSDGRPLLKVTPTAFVAPSNCSSSVDVLRRTSSATPAPAVYTIKEEPDNSDDEEIPMNNQRLVLSEEERRLMRKEGLVLPTHYPLSKPEERDLKRIRRKIRNKISAQDSRKRKKEYVDGLEDRVKACTDENHQLQKRVRHLEKQNETLIMQLKRVHNLVGSNLNSRHPHASTALMMLVLSAALIVVPSLRPQDGQGENDLSSSPKLPASGHSRSLLEVGTSSKIRLSNPMDIFDAPEEEEIETMSYTSALSDHDYSPLTKKPLLESDRNLFFVPPAMDKFISMGEGDPPDGKGGTKGVATFFGAMLEKLGSNWTDPGGSAPLPTKTASRGLLGRSNGSSVVVNLSRDGRFRDDIELE